jgi:hypothetical protein
VAPLTTATTTRYSIAPPTTTTTLLRVIKHTVAYSPTRIVNRYSRVCADDGWEGVCLADFPPPVV